MFREPDKRSKEYPFEVSKTKITGHHEIILLDCEIYQFKPTITLIIPLGVWSLDLRLPVDDVQHIAV